MLGTFAEYLGYCFALKAIKIGLESAFKIVQAKLENPWMSFVLN